MSKNLATKDAKLALEELAKAHAPEALAALVRVFKHGKTESARVAAACALLDRAFGRPAQAIAVAATHSLHLLSDAELAARAIALTTSGLQGGFRAAPALAAPARPAGEFEDDGLD